MDINEKNISRRGFLKTAAAIGTAMAVEPVLEKVQAANRLVAKDNYRVPTKHEGMQYRTLGSGRAAMTVSALGFGCMGMTYNRSQHPSKEQMTRLLHEAVSRGVTLFNTAIIYGPLHNEFTQFDTTNDNRHALPRFQPEALRQNTRIVNVLQQFGRTRGMTSAQVALAWLLNKAPFIVPIPGTTKTAHFEENLHTLDFLFSDSEWAELEQQVAAIPVVGDRYGADQQKQVM